MRRLWLRHILQIVTLIVAICVGAIFLVGIIIDEKTPPKIADTFPPVVTLKGGEKITIPLGEPYEDEGVDAYDIDGEVKISVEGIVDHDNVGEYIIKYTVIDEADNKTDVSRIVNVVKPSGIIYLTFDDGPSEHTARLLDTLKRYGVKATFFVTGNGDDEILKREYDEGHAIGLHTLSHNYSYICQNTDSFFADLNAVGDRVKSITGTESKLMRFPGGSSNLVSRRYDGHSHIMSMLTAMVEEQGFTYFDWNVDSNDAGGASSSDEVYNNVVSTLKRGGESVVLQHDVKDFSVDAVENIIKYGNENGFVFKKLEAGSFNAHHGTNN